MADVNLRELDREAFIENQLAGYKELPDLVHLWPHIFGEMATGRAVDPARVAALAGWSLERTLAVLDGGEWDSSGERLVGFGLTSIETPHRIEIDGVTMWAWCAPDTLGIPGLIGKSARIHSACPATGDPIRVHVTPTGVESVDPAGAVVSNVSASLIATEGRQGTCDVSSFYRDTDAASDWLAAHPNGTVLPVRDHVELYREVLRRLDAWLAQQPD